MANPITSIDHSYADSAALACPQCGQPFSAHIWLIVDASARPDLLERVRRGDLHAVAYPTCGPLAQADAPLLLYRPGAEPTLLFSPAQRTSAEQDQQQAHDLLSRLAASLGDDWDEAWLAQGITGVQRAMLPAR